MLSMNRLADFLHTHTHTHTHISTHTHAHTHTNPHTHAHIPTNTHIQTRTYTPHSHTLTHVHALVLGSEEGGFDIYFFKATGLGERESGREIREMTWQLGLVLFF